MLVALKSTRRKSRRANRESEFAAKWGDSSPGRLARDQRPIDLLLPPIEGELLPESEVRFFERLSGIPVAFSRDAQGKVTGFAVCLPGKESYFEKVSGQQPDAPKPPKRPVAIKLDVKLLDACVGQYKFGPSAMFPAGIIVTIWRDEDRLILHEEGENAVPGAISFYPESEASFFTKMDPAQLTFVKNDQGEVTAATIHAPGLSDYEGKKQNRGDATSN